ncbi:PstS family phosphate ABC transporter substrate-binding protein [Dysgonomonas sp. 520]|uniref:PstS family phosphate ABC transporter substrate-binding protein n=1 Tax=Dysgonomonas sp. 520 TaxID=2302931 RepID=UPI0013D19D3C|nr:substrate-binding domain-containing protein [Dysgonomonas sp. 520]NDW11101.1 phosphate ABC transporter substrate-binding protein [Dysgonomonas sp. 520]
MKKISLLGLLIVAIIAISACNDKKGNGGKNALRDDTETSGFAVVAGEDCFAPIVEELINVFEGVNKDAYVQFVNTSEHEAFNMLLDDSVRMIIAARDLTKEEKDHIKSKDRSLNPRSQKIAIDGVALIINKANTDSLMSLSTLKKIMTGEITSWKQINPQSKLDNISVLFDSPSSSTVRFMKDSICGGSALYSELRAQKSNKDVLEKVSKTPEALGIIGVNWIHKPIIDSTKMHFSDIIRVVSVSRSDVATPDNSYKPYAAYLAFGDYPLRRDIYAILTDLRETLPAGFMKYLTGNPGQRVVLKSGLLPAIAPTRLVEIQDNMK